MNPDRKKIFDKFGGRCAYCGCELTKSFQVDHIVSKKHLHKTSTKKIEFPYFLKHLTENDLDHIDNLSPSCIKCNFYKGIKSLEDFRYELIQLTRRLKKRVFIYNLALNYGLIQEMDKKEKIVFYFETLIIPISGKYFTQLKLGEIE